MRTYSILRKIIFFIFAATIFSVAQQAKTRIACIGNSITYGGLGEQSYPQQLQKKLGSQYEVKNFGVSGATLLKNGDLPYWSLPEFVDALNFDPHIVIIKLGTNDSKPFNWLYKDQFFSNYMELVAAFRMFHRRPQIYVGFPIPVFKENQFGGISESVVKNEIIPLVDSIKRTAKTYLIDFYSLMKNQDSLVPDGVHPNAIGYEKMAQLVFDTIMHGQSGTIRYFYAQREILYKNEKTTLYWNTSDSSKAFLNGNPVNPIDSLQITPTNTTTYTLTTQGKIIDSISRTVFYYPPGRIKSFRSSMPSYEIGSVDSITLFWETGIGSTVSLNGTPIKQHDSLIVSVRSDTMFTLRAVGEITDTQTIHIAGIETEKYNRALWRRATASSTNWGSSISAVNDGDTATYWKNAPGKILPWILIDFGKTISITNVRLKWGNVYATNYYLIIEKESGEAEAIYNDAAGNGEIDDISGISGIGRRLKILFLQNNTFNDPYILNEVEVYGMKMLTSVKGSVVKSIPFEYGLEQNYPNPFNPTTNISYSIPQSGMVKITIVDILGRVVMNAVNQYQKAGSYTVTLDAATLATGMYIYRLESGAYTSVKKMLVIK
ncbi:MAG: GDSL-type esterase/lipase family protein [Bacteroidota bacterium]|nr:GDSL-type esterase/lipase family protein [Bacteroidota bacterium]